MDLKRRILVWITGAAWLGVSSFAATSYAEQIDPGFDLFRTKEGSGSFINFTLDDFGPVDVGLVGNPILKGFEGTNTDTVVRRNDSLDPGVIGTIPVELVALSLISVDPVKLNNDDLFDVKVTLGPSKVHPIRYT